MAAAAAAPIERTVAAIRPLPPALGSYRKAVAG